MARFHINSLLDDAHQLLCQASGLPATKTAETQRRIFLRAAAIFSWMAVEESAKAVLYHFKREGVINEIPPKLSERIIVAIALQNSRRELSDSNAVERAIAQARETYDIGRFTTLRALRNNLVHANSGSELLSPDEVRSLYSFAKETITQIARMPVLHEGYQISPTRVLVDLRHKTK